MLKKDKGPTDKEMAFIELVTRRINQYLEISHEEASIFVLDILDALTEKGIKIK